MTDRQTKRTDGRVIAYKSALLHFARQKLCESYRDLLVYVAYTKQAINRMFRL